MSFELNNLCEQKSRLRLINSLRTLSQSIEYFRPISCVLFSQTHNDIIKISTFLTCIYSLFFNKEKLKETNAIMDSYKEKQANILNVHKILSNNQKILKRKSDFQCLFSVVNNCSFRIKNVLKSQLFSCRSMSY